MMILVTKGLIWYISQDTSCCQKEKTIQNAWCTGELLEGFSAKYAGMLRGPVMSSGTQFPSLLYFPSLCEIHPMASFPHGGKMATVVPGITSSYRRREIQYQLLFLWSERTFFPEASRKTSPHVSLTWIRPLWATLISLTHRATCHSWPDSFGHVKIMADSWSWSEVKLILLHNFLLLRNRKEWKGLETKATVSISTRDID